MKRSMLAGAVALALGAGLQAHAHNGEDHGAAAAAAPQAPAARDAGARSAGPAPDARAYFTDLELLTQNGKKVRFYSDVLAGHTVVINVAYTNCQDACPLITQWLNDVRSRIPEHFGKSVHFITISSDPVRDTPQALKEFAQKQGADVAGWTWLTGSKANVDHILKKLGQYNEHVEEHSTLVIAGNVPAKRWTKIRPDAQPVVVAERVRVLVGADKPQ